MAITIPSIMGYVGKAKDAQYEAEARSGYVAAQTITAREVAKQSTLTADQLKGKITAAEVAKELKEDGDGATKTVSKAGCIYTGQKIKKCGFELTAKTGTYIIFTAQDTTNNKGADTEITEKLPDDLKGAGDLA